MRAVHVSISVLPLLSLTTDIKMTSNGSDRFRQQQRHRTLPSNMGSVSLTYPRREKKRAVSPTLKVCFTKPNHFFSFMSSVHPLLINTEQLSNVKLKQSNRSLQKHF